MCSQIAPTDRCQAAIAALRRAAHAAVGTRAVEALAATAQIAARRGARSRRAGALWQAVTAPPAPHPTGLPAGAAGGTCGDCAWRVRAARRARCRQADAKIDPMRGPRASASRRALDCQTCGACCRAAYHSVEVQPRDPVVKAQPTYIVDRGTYLEIRRAGDRCAALGAATIARRHATRYHCVIYDDRPRRAATSRSAPRTA